jgi:hypothetical protein
LFHLLRDDPAFHGSEVKKSQTKRHVLHYFVTDPAHYRSRKR